MLVKISLKPLFMLRLSALPRSKSTKSHSVAIYCPCKLGWDDYNKSTIACNKCNDWYHYPCLPIIAPVERKSRTLEMWPLCKNTKGKEGIGQKFARIQIVFPHTVIPVYLYEVYSSINLLLRVAPWRGVVVFHQDHSTGTRSLCKTILPDFKRSNHIELGSFREWTPHIVHSFITTDSSVALVSTLKLQLKKIIKTLVNSLGL